jgi:hypothetical protein
LIYELYRSLLCDEFVPFWLRHGVDHEYAGVPSSMAENGTRFVFRTGRQAVSSKAPFTVALEIIERV